MAPFIVTVLITAVINVTIVCVFLVFSLSLRIHWKHCLVDKWYNVWKAIVARTSSARKVFLDISQNLQKNTCVRVSFLIELQDETCNFIKKRGSGFIKKETLAQVFSCEFCEISKNNVSYRTPPLTASDFALDSAWKICAWKLIFDRKVD